MASTIKVSMADLKVAKAPDSLTTLGLGSCIGLTLYDPASKIGGLVHYMLPDSTKLRNNTNIAKFGDTGIRELYNQMIKNGANPRRMVAKIAGGAKMFEMSGNSTIGNVGDRMLSWRSHARNGRNKLRLLARKNLKKPFLQQRTFAKFSMYVLLPYGSGIALATCNTSSLATRTCTQLRLSKPLHTLAL